MAQKTRAEEWREALDRALGYWGDDRQERNRPLAQKLNDSIKEILRALNGPNAITSERDVVESLLSVMQTQYRLLLTTDRSEFEQLHKALEAMIPPLREKYRQLQSGRDQGVSGRGGR